MAVVDEPLRQLDDDVLTVKSPELPVSLTFTVDALPAPTPENARLAGARTILGGGGGERCADEQRPEVKPTS